jgi:hypothetical protein
LLTHVREAPKLMDTRPLSTAWTRVLAIGAPVKKTRVQIAYCVLVAGFLGAFLAMRRADILAGRASSVDALAAAVLLALALLPVFREVTLGGVTLKSAIEAIVQKEVGKAQRLALQLAARRDLQMVPIWEQEHSSTPSDFSERKVQLLEQTITELEDQWAKAAPDDRVHFGMALREAYWAYLTASRHHWASAAPYHDVKRLVENGFASLADVPPPSRPSTEARNAESR